MKDERDAFVVVCRLFQNYLLKKFFQEYYQSVKLFETVWIQIRTDVSVGPDLGSNCLKRLSADNKSRNLLCLI